MTVDEAKKIVVGNEFLIYAVNSGLPLDEAEKNWEQAIRIVDELITYWKTGDLIPKTIGCFWGKLPGTPEHKEALAHYQNASGAYERCAKRLQLLTSGKDPNKSDENWFLERE